MTLMPEHPPCVKSQGKQLCLFVWSDSLPTTVAAEPEFARNHRLVQRVQHRTGWSEALCRAAIEANGGSSYV
jgi:hypothetical protein